MIGFPLLLIPFAIYNVIAFLMPFDWNTKLYALRLPSGVMWEPTASDAFIVFSLLMLMFEFIKSTTHGKSLVEHFLAICLVGGAGAEFAMVNPNATSLTVSVTVRGVSGATITTDVINLAASEPTVFFLIRAIQSNPGPERQCPAYFRFGVFNCGTPF